MTKVHVEMELCSFCHDFHQQYMKGVPFLNARKSAVTDCRMCEDVMCADCKASSQKELQDDLLGVYGLTICQRCMKTRRLTTRHKEYEAIAETKLTEFKAGIRREIYHLTKSKHAVSN